jgi:hypothetical protein
LLLFGFLLGAAFAVKLGILVGAPLIVYVLLVSLKPVKIMVLLALAVMTGAVLTSGWSFGIDRMHSVLDMVYFENVKAAERSLSWNVVHYAASIIPGMGVHFGVILSLSVLGWLHWARTIPILGLRWGWDAAFISV